MTNIFKEKQNGVVLFLGRVVNFTEVEIKNFLEEQGMQYANKYEGQEIALVVLSSMLTPLEEQISYDLYDIGVPDVSLSKFEEYFTTHIKPNSLIMSLKLSNDQDRLKRLLKNEAFLDEVYLKLFRLYNWGNNGIYENNDNRDITISFVKRFYRPNGFRDPAMIYAPTTVMNVAQESKDSILLDAMLTMPNHQIKISQREEKRPKNIRELVAFNEYISQETVKRLLGFNNVDINYFIASNSALTQTQQKHIFDKSDNNIKMMLAHNSNLSDNLFEKLLTKIDTIKTILTFQTLNSKRLEIILSNIKDFKTISHIGYNLNIKDIIESLSDLNIKELDFKLASNISVKEKYLKELYNRHKNKIVIELSKNSNLSKEMIEEFYKSKDTEIIKALAVNTSTPTKILDEMCELNDRELNRLLASNSSVSLSYLQQFQLDPTLIMILAKNETYGKNILTGLGI